MRIRTLQRPDLIESVAAYVARTRYTGAICVDFISADEGYLIDVNPRFFGSWAALQAAGLPLLETYVDHLRGVPAVPNTRQLGEIVQWTAPHCRGQSPRYHPNRDRGPAGIRAVHRTARLRGRAAGTGPSRACGGSAGALTP